MSEDDKKDDAKPRSTGEAARRIWLAGIGAYGRAFSEAQDALKDVSGKGGEIFEDLVKKGSMIEKVVEVKGKDLMEKASVPNFDMDERIKAMRLRLSRSSDASEDISARLDIIEAKLDKVLVLLGDTSSAKKAKPKAKPVKKPSTKRTRTQKTAAKSVVKKKPAPKKKTRSKS